MPANTALPMFLTIVRQKYTYGNMAESELLCVIGATLLRNKYVIRQNMSELSIYFFYCSGYLPRHNYCPDKNYRHYSGHNLCKDKLKS